MNQGVSCFDGVYSDGGVSDLMLLLLSSSESPESPQTFGINIIETSRWWRCLLLRLQASSSSVMISSKPWKGVNPRESEHGKDQDPATESCSPRTTKHLITSLKSNTYFETRHCHRGYCPRTSVIIKTSFSPTRTDMRFAELVGTHKRHAWYHETGSLLPTMHPGLSFTKAQYS